MRLFLVLALTIFTVLPAWAQQVPGTWQALANTRLDQAKRADGVSPILVLLPYGETSGLGGIFAYSGGTYDTLRKQILFVGTGGHGDWAGNQVVGLQINAADQSVKWLLHQDTGKREDGTTWAYPYLTSPTNPVCTLGPDGKSLLPLQPWPCREESRNIYADGTKPSFHTYGNQVYIPETDSVLTAGGLRWSDAEPNKPGQGYAGASPMMWFWKQGTGYYLKPSTRPGGYSGALVHDPATGYVYLFNSGGIQRYNVPADQWATMYTKSGFLNSESSQVVIDPVGRNTYRFNRHTSAPFTVRRADLNNLAAGETLLATTGATVALGSSGAALLWDPELPGLVTVAKDGVSASAVHTLSLALPCGGPSPEPPCQWVKRGVLAGHLPPTTGGSWGKLASDGEYLYWVMSALKDVTRYRKEWASAAPSPPDRTLTIVPAGPSAGTTRGAGTYPHGTVVAPVTMDADKVCTSTFGLKTRPLTLTSSGTGAGTVSGAGGYPHAPQAIIAAVPAPGSATESITDEGCPSAPGPVPAGTPSGPRFVEVQHVDAAGNSGQASTPPQPPPLSTTLPPANTWRMVPERPAADPVTIRAGKHFRCFKDKKRGTWVCAGGDRSANPYDPAGEQGSDGGNPAISSLDPATGRITLISPMCPAAPAVMPAFPDNVVWVHDTRRDLYWMFRGFFFGQVNARTGANRPLTVCKRDMNPASPAYDPNVLMKDVVFSPTTKTWALAPSPVSPYGYGSDGSGPTFGVYDEPTDSTYMFKKDGAWGAALMIYRHASNDWKIVKLGAPHPSGSDQKNMIRNALLFRSMPTILNGWLYVMSIRGNQPDPAIPNNSAMITINLANPETEAGQIAYRVPAGWTLPTGAEEVEAYSLAIPKYNVIVHPFAPGLTPALQKLMTFDAVGRKWLEDRPVPVPPAVIEPIHGGNWLFDEATEEIVVIGRRVRGFQGYATWRYRWEP